MREIIVSKLITDHVVKNAIYMVSKYNGSDVDGDVVHIAGKTYYIDMRYDKIIDQYIATPVDKCIHICSMILYALLELLSVVLFWVLTWNIVNILNLEGQYHDIIIDIALMIIIMIFTYKMQRYLLQSGIFSAYLEIKDQKMVIYRSFAIAGLCVLCRKAGYILCIIIILYSTYMYGFGPQSLFHLCWGVAFMRFCTVAYHISLSFMPNPADIYDTNVYHIKNKYLKPYVYLLYGLK